MKLGYLVAVLPFSASVVAAQANATFVASQIAKISSCGLECLSKTIPMSGCSITNTTCQCANTRLTQTTASCMMANCTLVDTLSLNQIQATICERPYESQNKKMRIMTIVCAVITNGAAVLRFGTRLLLHQPFGWDDWALGAATVTEGLFAYYGVLLENDGLGDHVWTIKLSDITSLFYWFYICEFLYVLTIGLVKCSILFFYLRVFPKKSLRHACWATIGFCVASTIAFTLVTVFQCKPINFTWRKDLQGQCVNYNSVAWANAGINILQDFIIILLPMNELRHLNLNRKKKIGMYAMFGVGGFVCITSIIRLDSLRTFGLTADPTWDNIPTVFWSTIETATAIFCACMPAIRAGVVHFFPRFLGSTMNHGTADNLFNSRRTGGTGGKGTISSRTEMKHAISRPVDFKSHPRSMTLTQISSSGHGPKSPDTFHSTSSISTVTEVKIGFGEKRTLQQSKQQEPKIIRIAAFAAPELLELNKPLPLTPITPSIHSNMAKVDEEKKATKRSSTPTMSSTDTNLLIQKHT